MSTNSFVNLDARALWQIVQGDGILTSSDRAVLLQAASHLESMDAKIARHIDGTFAAGEAEAALRSTSRSNLLRPPRKFTNAEGEVVIAALTARQVHRLPAGARTPAKPKPILVPDKPSRPSRKGFRLEDL